MVNVLPRIDLARIDLAALGPGESVLEPAQVLIALALLAQAVIVPTEHVPADRDRVRIVPNRAPRFVHNPVLRMQVDALGAVSPQGAAMRAAQAATVLVVIVVRPLVVDLQRIAAQRRVAVRRPVVAAGLLVLLLEVVPAVDAAKEVAILPPLVVAEVARKVAAPAKVAARIKISR